MVSSIRYAWHGVPAYGPTDVWDVYSAGFYDDDDYDDDWFYDYYDEDFNYGYYVEPPYDDDAYTPYRSYGAYTPEVDGPYRGLYAEAWDDENIEPAPRMEELYYDAHDDDFEADYEEEPWFGEEVYGEDAFIDEDELLGPLLGD